MVGQIDRIDLQKAYNYYVRQNLHNDCTADAFVAGWNAAIEYLRFREDEQKLKDGISGYDDRSICIRGGKHMVDYDADGFCKNCGWKSIAACKGVSLNQFDFA